jgi:hypothetical protein
MIKTFEMKMKTKNQKTHLSNQTTSTQVLHPTNETIKPNEKWKMENGKRHE